MENVSVADEAEGESEESMPSNTIGYAVVAEYEVRPTSLGVAKRFV